MEGIMLPPIQSIQANQTGSTAVYIQHVEQRSTTIAVAQGQENQFVCQHGTAGGCGESEQCQQAFFYRSQESRSVEVGYVQQNQSQQAQVLKLPPINQCNSSGPAEGCDMPACVPSKHLRGCAGGGACHHLHNDKVMEDEIEIGPTHIITYDNRMQAVERKMIHEGFKKKQLAVPAADNNASSMEDSSDTEGEENVKSNAAQIKSKHQRRLDKLKQRQAASKSQSDQKLQQKLQHRLAGQQSASVD